jgi:hypothetical protein
MKKQRVLFLPMLFLLTSRLFALGEQTLRIGSGAGWTVVAQRSGVTELLSLRPWAVLGLLAAGAPHAEIEPDMYLSFDEGSPERFVDSLGHYKVTETPQSRAAHTVSQAGQLAARAGAGAARFSGTGSGGEGPLVITPLSSDALFSAGRRWGDFSIEFWIQPFNMENGERVFSWVAAKGRTGAVIQRIQCAVSKNRFQWTFLDFFASAGDENRTSFTLTGVTPVIPKVWSHHLIRFDAASGLLEYLVNGKPEAIAYATASGREGGEVYTPLAGAEGSLILGGQFAGLLDEVRIGAGFTADAASAKYPGTGGRIETSSIDLGEPNSQVVRVEAATGRFTIASGKARNEYAGAATLRFADEAALQFFIRASDSPYRFVNDWQPFVPGTDLGEKVRGRYVQLAVQFYPSGDGEASPYLDEIRIVYRPNEPPLPPALVTAVAKDGAVDLLWKNSPDLDTAGYFVYYGTASGVYFGDDAVRGASPLDAGKYTSIHIDGLKNGVLYYFAVAAYDNLNPLHIGAFSREVTARPLRMGE